MKYQIELKDSDVWFLFGLLSGDLQKMKTMNQTDMVKGAIKITDRIMRELHQQMKSHDDDIPK